MKTVLMKTVMFLITPMGRITRILAGVGLLVIGYLELHSNPALAYSLFVLGALPLVEGTFDLLFIGKALGLPISGKKLREMMAAMAPKA